MKSKLIAAEFLMIGSGNIALQHIDAIISYKKKYLLTLKIKFKFYFFTSNQSKIKNGISNPICFIRKISGNLI